MYHWPAVVVATPAHSGVGDLLSYRSGAALAAGTLVRVPLGSREVLGIVWRCDDAPPEGLAPGQARDVAQVLDALPPLDAGWRELVAFAARYYQRGLGEVALAALPPPLRELTPEQLARRLKRPAKAAAAEIAPDHERALSPEQATALAAIEGATAPVLLFGTTGSGKTEVYLQACAHALASEATAQVLVLVPEINLTPQLEERFRARFAAVHGHDAVVSLHSGMTPPQRLAAWIAAHTGRARIVLGTRLAVFASLPGLRLIVVDEEHDPSYKSQDGARYSARDLAIYRARVAGARVVLGSATPSLESWHASEQGRYRRLDMPSRIGGGALPRLRLVDMNHQPKGALIAPPLLAAMAERVARGEQCLVLINRRGYAPVLACHACGWKSGCPHCSAYRVFHKLDRTLRCHHCGFTQRVPRACPDCGNLDIEPIGRGTEQVEEQLAGLLAEARRPDGGPARVARMDADTTKAKGSLEAQLAALHAGEVDVLVGTQMIAKGHDFRRITLVAAINADASLFASDHRAPERLFALLLQAAGRAGRDAAHSAASELWVQTWHPEHKLFAHLRAHDHPGFAKAELADRQAAAMPPFAHQALLRADARTQEAAQGFLKAASRAAQALPQREAVTLYPAVPLTIQRVANVERAQLLVESDSRAALQRFLTAWQPLLLQARSAPEARGLIRYAVDVDPLSV
ncbi:replication restart helicase PriA [Hydrogenophaga sp. T2]|uniref:replication restart helicase PriA n=1 Tax=Hydrogenophaga sp. T2 TaxID=3132823 RepID=UPI003CF0C7CB